jgi:peptidoglycan/LPS O-acetylase OafA/YrhL
VQSFIPEIDGLRFFAIFTVMLFHLNTTIIGSTSMGIDQWKLEVPTESIAHFGWWLIRFDIGVKVFFAISGFILTIPFLKQRLYAGSEVKIKDYLYRRLTRLEPPFVISLAFFFGVHLFVLNADFRTLLPHLLSGLVYGHVLIYGTPNPVNPVTWSLETEAQFYVFLPLIVGLIFASEYKVVRFAAFLFLFIGGALLKEYIFEKGLSHLSGSFFAYFGNFAVGAVFSYLYLTGMEWFKREKTIFFDLIGGLSILIMFYYYKPQALWQNHIILNFAILGLFISTFRGYLLNRLFTFAPVYLIGGMCYSIYLLHYAFYHLLVPVTLKYTLDWSYWSLFVVQAVIVLTFTIIVSAIFYLLIEKPCMDKNWPVKLRSWLYIRLF